ncbi:MAG: PTS sugar transporter subunit IIC [Erysipelotrichaceae bacterium]|jgi:mannose/fructose/N-acetylgalactosamine-specific phosphotransferase system component IIC|nr:PTS sugar transporter subunit IIC [Bacillota bacterium]NLP21660.1 PTS sugar transporter subunit IIC [Erysipelotrichaceae bacterium]HCY05974.1 PTS sugar transporter subunit IIC [Erysipelotrichaceae bacterium]
MNNFVTALLVGLWVTWAIIDEQTLQLQTTRPIITGPVVGLICGDLQTGLIVGATVELMFLATIFVGTAVPPDPTLSSAIATALAIYSGRGVDIAVATALPVALIGQVVTTLQYSVVNVAFLHLADRKAENGDTKGLVRTAWYPLIVNLIFYGLPTFLAVYYGAQYVTNIIDAIPEKIITGLAVGGGMIGSVGFALLLTTIKSKNLWPFFLVGLISATYLKINNIGIGLIAVMCVALYLEITKKRGAK